MNASQAIEKIAQLIGLSFKSQKFYSTVLVDGETEITNNLDEELAVGHTLYIVGDSTLSPAPQGEHETREGLVLVVSEESIITEIKQKSEEVVEDQVEVENSEVQTEATEVKMEELDELTDMVAGIIDALTPESVTPELAEEIAEKVLESLEDKVEVVEELKKKTKMSEDFSTEISQIKEGISQLLSVVDSINGKFTNEINELKSEVQEFKKSPERKPIEKKADFKKSFEDYRVEFLNTLK